MRSVLTSAAAVLVLSAWCRSASAEDASYTKDVKPFVEKYCMSCHADGKGKAGYSVETYTSLTKKGRKGALVVAEKPDDSRLITTMEGKGKPMPPKKAPQPKAEEIAKVKDWIKAGAKDDSPADDRKKNPLQ
jgi:hypothetical protein